MNTVSVLILICAGLLFQFPFFLKNDFPLYLIHFFLFGLSMVPAALFVATLIKSASTSSTYKLLYNCFLEVESWHLIISNSDFSWTTMLIISLYSIPRFHYFLGWFHHSSRSWPDLPWRSKLRLASSLLVLPLCCLLQGSEWFGSLRTWRPKRHEMGG